MATFGETLRAQIEIAGMNQAQLASAVGWSPSQISALVTGRRKGHRAQIEALDEALGAGGLLVRRWAEQRKRQAEPEWLQQVADVEDRAFEIRAVQPFLLPGVLQSPDYVRAVVRMGRPLDNEEAVEAIVERRMRRQEHLLRADGPRISVLVPDHVIRSARSIHPGSLDHVLALAESASMTVQVLPGDQHLAAAVGPFRLIGLEDRPNVVFAESAVGGAIVDHPAEVARFVAVANALQARGVDPDKSRRWIEEANE
ncbi:helix-turn-helix domain-containing protein [Nocardiopsis trehalosi]|uniref:helix-turn-helix domain-containing protein n=1 Tax=Nocardiopsis trehalosi TaxID=109329 RepID=UPI000A01F2A3|nr:helix-turn-helix transcriptional regulator [Nocardiopsis trehalosi]